jgi:hypothetical protein
MQLSMRLLSDVVQHLKDRTALLESVLGNPTVAQGRMPKDRTERSKR